MRSARGAGVGALIRRAAAGRGTSAVRGARFLRRVCLREASPEESIGDPADAAAVFYVVGIGVLRDPGGLHSCVSAGKRDAAEDQATCQREENGNDPVPV